jgi:hypothetical protein
VYKERARERESERQRERERQIAREREREGEREHACRAGHDTPDSACHLAERAITNEDKAYEQKKNKRV